VLLRSLHTASVVKCNDDELPVMASRLELSNGDDVSLLNQMIDRCSLRQAVLTRGSNGSLIVDDSGEVSEQPTRVVDVKDTVGAGDAFTAAVAIGLLRGHALVEIHEWASCVAAFVCTQPGATPIIPVELRSAAVF